jgi:hypothetical protein
MERRHISTTKNAHSYGGLLLVEGDRPLYLYLCGSKKLHGFLPLAKI